MTFGDRLRAVLRPLPGEERGFTIIEILVASFILVLGSLAIFMTFAAAIHNVQRSRESQVGISVAQREMERVRVIPFESLGLSTLPLKSNVAENPRYRIRTSGVEQFDIDRDTPQTWRDLVAGGTVAPETTGVRTNDGTEVTVYRFVVCEEAACLAKRVVIDVWRAQKANLGTYRPAYTELQSTIVSSDPGSP